MGDTPYADYLVDVPEGRSGPWRVERFTVEKDDLGRIHYALQGRDVTPGTYTRLMKDGRPHDPMMSDTPSEVRDLFPAVFEIRERGGRVLLNGLGLGVILKVALATPEVTHVDVVEVDPDIASLVWPTYAGDPRAALHLGDAYTIAWPRGVRWSVAWHDVWPTICTDNLPEMARLHRKYGRRVDWQGSWAKEWLMDMRRRDGGSIS